MSILWIVNTHTLLLVILMILVSYHHPSEYIDPLVEERTVESAKFQTKMR